MDAVKSVTPLGTRQAAPMAATNKKERAWPSGSELIHRSLFSFTIPIFTVPALYGKTALII